MRARLVAVVAALALALGVGGAAADELDLEVEIPELAEQAFDVSDAQLRWGLNEETGSGAFAGGCNFLSAGAVGDTGGAKVWTEADGHFRAKAGAVTIERPVATSRGTTYRPMTFAERCTDARGRTVEASSPRGTGVTAVIDGGSGRVDPVAGEARISWKGSVTVVFYGGLTSWWFTDPVLEVSEGRGTLSATAEGFGTSREDTSRWERLPATTIVLAELPEVSVRADRGFSALPAYLGVEVDVPAGAPSQRRSGEEWGSFPQSFVDFQEGTGQQAFWYSSGGARDPAKPATRLTVSYDAADPREPEDGEPDEGEPDPDPPGEGDRPVNPIRPRPVAPPPAVVVPAGDALAAPAVSALPPAVPSSTVLPLAAAPLAVELEGTGRAPRAEVLALAGLVLGLALTLLGYRARLLRWPSRKARP